MHENRTLISCDEAGFTGPALLDENQRVFAFASIDLSVDEATRLIEYIRTQFRIQATELKSNSLRKRNDWNAIAKEIAQNLSGHAILIVADKRLNLGGKTFEYVFEPVLEKKISLFYRYNLHKFVMNALHKVFFSANKPVPALAYELQAFMRSFEPSDAPSLFCTETDQQSGEILSCVLRFANGYSDIITSETAHLREDADQTTKWTLDLSTTFLFSVIMQGWGYRHTQIDVLCDDSKPLKAMAHIFDGWVKRQNTTKVTDGRWKMSVYANLSNPVRFGSSRDNPTLQIADVLAGATADVVSENGRITDQVMKDWTTQHMHVNYILPDQDHINMNHVLPCVNLAVLKELARRADQGADPLDRMEAYYASKLRSVRLAKRAGVFR